MIANNEALEELLKFAGLPVDVKKVIGAKVLVNYALSQEDLSKRGHHLFTQITGIRCSYHPANCYMDLRVSLACQEVFSGAKIVQLEFSRPAYGSPDPEWSLSVEGAPGEKNIRMAVCLKFLGE